MSQLIMRLERLRTPVVDLTEESQETTTVLGRWIAAASAAPDGCVVLDPHGQVVALSPMAATLLGCTDTGVVGRKLLEILTLVDFEAGREEPEYSARVPPLAVLREGGAARSLIRVRCHNGGNTTLDVSSVAIHEHAGQIVGSLSWVVPIRRF